MWLHKLFTIHQHLCHAAYTPVQSPDITLCLHGWPGSKHQLCAKPWYNPAWLTRLKAPTNYVQSPAITLCGWLGSKHQLCAKPSYNPAWLTRLKALSAKP